MAGKWRNCTGPSALIWGSNASSKIFRWNTYTFLCASNPRTPKRTVGCTRNGIHSGVGLNTMSVPAFDLPEVLIYNLFWCWFCCIIYIDIELKYTLISYPFCSGIFLKIRTASREQRGTEWLSEVLIIHMKYRTKKQVFSCLQRTLLHANDVRFIILRLLYVMCTHLYRCVWRTGTVKAACKTAFLYGLLAT